MTSHTELPLAGHHAVVTGGGAGIGAAIADKLHELGANLTLMDIAEENLKKKCAELPNAQPVTVDATDAASIKQAFADATKKFGHITILVNNVGTGISAPFQKLENDTWNFLLNINLNSVFYCTREVLPAMIENGWGRIINMGSTAGVKGFAYITAYCAAKHGVIGLTRALAIETARTGVTVNALCPGYANTDLLEKTIKNIMDKTGMPREKAEDSLKANNPQRRFIEPYEIANTVAWLCLPGSESVTGQSIAIAGGEIM